MDSKPVLDSSDIRAGFLAENKRVPFINPQRGIFKPSAMQALLSIRTVYPKKGAKVWYDDQREVHQQIMNGSASVAYAFMGDDPQAPENRWLKEALESQVPIIYFLGVAPARYIPIFPCFVGDWDAKLLRAEIFFNEPFSNPLSAPTQDVAERRYALRQVKQRLHQASFREAVVAAYGGRCALSGLPEAALLDAAHIVADADENFGQPVVPNGIPLSKIHHAAFDAHLIGISPDFKVRVAERLLTQRDGPMLEALKSLNGAALRLPPRDRDRPDQDRLAQRYEEFLLTE
ncbi:HNH endonuclease [Ramlibacter humi]|nr:HNH endonuclease [Ramlibacter humi]